MTTPGSEAEGTAPLGAPVQDSGRQAGAPERDVAASPASPAPGSSAASAEELRAAEEERAVEQALALVGRPPHTSHRPPARPRSSDRAHPSGQATGSAFGATTPPFPEPSPSTPSSSSGSSSTPPSPDTPSPNSPPYVNPPYVNPPYVNPPYVNPPYVNPPYVNPPYPVPDPPSMSQPSPDASRGSVPGSSDPSRRHAPPTRRAHATSWDDARALAARLGHDAPVPALRLPLDRALGHVLAEALHALTDLPSFDTSAMDGWAVAGPGPWKAAEGEGLLAGRRAPCALPDGEAVRIATGARIPPDATAVIRSEHAHIDEAKGLLHARREVVHGQDIRPRGQECRLGDLLLPVGTLVTPAVLGLAAAAGYDALVAVPRPRVDVLVLGDELLTTGLPHDGLIRDALGPMLAPWLRALGAEVSEPRRLGDDAEALRQALTTSDADLIVTTGGTAAGPVDHVHPVLRQIGAELLVDGVAVRPGHPMLLARLAEGGPYLVGLPGNPLAAVSGLLTLAEPLLQGIAGRAAQDPYRAVVHDEVHGHPHDTRLVPVVHRADGAGGTDRVVPLHYNGPAMLRGIAAADGLAVVPPGGVRSGTEVEILDLPWASATPWTEGRFT